MIEIDIAPNMFSSGSFVLSWHGFFSFVAVATAVFLVGRWARFRGVLADDIYTIAVWAIVGGVLGARLVHVVDHWGSFYQDNPVPDHRRLEGGHRPLGRHPGRLHRRGRRHDDHELATGGPPGAAGAEAPAGAERGGAGGAGGGDREEPAPAHPAPSPT